MLRRSLFRLRLAIYWPFLYLYFRGSKRARVVIRCNGDVLLVQDRWKLWFDDRGYTVPGGGIDTNEQPADGAVRELKEELGIVTTAAHLQLIGQEIVRQHHISYYAYFFVLDIVARPDLHLQQSELASTRWFTPEELPTTELKLEAQRALELAAKS